MKRTEFDWKDPLNLESLLSDDDRMIRDSARDFAQKELLPGIIEANRHEKFDPDIMKKMGSMGLLGPTLEGYGCSGVSQIAYGLIAKEMEAVDSGYRSALSVQSSLVMYPIYTFGSDAVDYQFPHSRCFCRMGQDG
jgi:glutaryl-CoA dehydrogenase